MGEKGFVLCIETAFHDREGRSESRNGVSDFRSSVSVKNEQRCDANRKFQCTVICSAEHHCAAHTSVLCILRTSCNTSGAVRPTAGVLLCNVFDFVLAISPQSGQSSGTLAGCHMQS